MGIATKQQCLLLPTAACGGAGPDPQHVLHPLSAGIFFFFFPPGGGGEAHKHRESPPPWRPPRGRSGCLAPVRVLLGFPHQPAGMQVPGGTLGCRKAAGGGPGSPPTWARGQGQPGGLPGSWQGRSSLPREEEEELSSLTACSQISPLLLLIPPRKPGWALFSSPPPPPPISLKCNSFHQNLVSHEAYNEFYVYLKWSDIRHPIILTPREKHGLNV